MVRTITDSVRITNYDKCFPHCKSLFFHQVEFDKEVQAHKKTKNTVDFTVREKVQEAIATLNEQWEAKLK